jgi:hypothetical protein
MTTLRRMDGAWLVRLRWRRRGAWLWPAFAALTVVDAITGHALPPSGDTQSLVAAGLLGLVLNVLGVLLLSRPLAALLRRRRRDLPVVVARDYAGTAVVVSVSAALLVVGLIHRPAIEAADRDMRDATARAQAWIGDRAPAEFRRNATHLNTFVIQPGMYRTCVPSMDRRRSYCVIVKTWLPFERSVSFDGYEPNSIFAEGVG